MLSGGSMALVTIITPTYNRKAKLVDLFESLQKQNNKNFEWLVVDDGSVDGTENRVMQFKEVAQFPVQYIRKSNGGKHTALNLGIKHISTPLTFIVDSDDQLLENGIELIEKYYFKYVIDSQVGAFAFLRCDEKLTPIVEMPVDEYIGSYIEERIKSERAGDMAEVFLTSVLKEFPFPEFVGEKFLSEDVVWIQIGLKYKFVFINQIVYQCEYLKDGLTYKDKVLKFASPLGSMMRGKMLMHKECGIRPRVKGAIIYDCYRREISRQIPDCLKIKKMADKILVFILKPLGAYFNRRWKK